jgi:hypothetical protein
MGYSTEMSSSLLCSAFILVVALILSFFSIYTETFIGSPDALPCGVDKPPCKFGEMCINGFCNNPEPPSLPPTTGLPVLP